MVTAIAKRTFLFKQEYVSAGKKKDIVLNRGEKTTMTEQEAIKFWGALKFDDKTEKQLLTFAKTNKVKRDV